MNTITVEFQGDAARLSPEQKQAIAAAAMQLTQDGFYTVRPRIHGKLKDGFTLVAEHMENAIRLRYGAAPRGEVDDLTMALAFPEQHPPAEPGQGSEPFAAMLSSTMARVRPDNPTIRKLRSRLIRRLPNDVLRKWWADLEAQG